MSSSKATALQSKFLSSLPEDARNHVFALMGKLAPALGEWVARYPTLMRPVRVPQVALTVAATAPFLGVEALLPTAKLICWIFAADDLVDEHQGPLDDVWPRLQRAVALLEQPARTDTGGDALLEALRQIRDELARYPLFATLQPRLAKAMSDFMAGMRQESEWSAEYRNAPHHPYPSASEYLESELRTSGSLPIFLSVLTTLGDGSVPAHLSRLLAMEHEAAIGIRIANDLRGYERESSQGKLNVLGIRKLELMREQGLEEAAALEQARTKLKGDIAAALKSCELLDKNEHTESKRPECFIQHLAAFTCDFYAHHDYHHLLVNTAG